MKLCGPDDLGSEFIRSLIPRSDKGQLLKRRVIKDDPFIAL